MTRTRIPFWKIALGPIGGLLALGLGAGLWVEYTARSRWSRMGKALQDIEVGLRSRDPARRPLRGVPLPGNAWVDYKQAFADISGELDSSQALREFALRNPGLDRSRVDPVLAKLSPALDHLSRGASRSEVAFPKGWQSENTGAGYMGGRWLGWIAVCRARILAEGGNPRQAAELMMDTCQFGRDLWSNGLSHAQSDGLMTIGLALDELKLLLESGKLTPADCAVVVRGLEALEATLPGWGSGLLIHVHGWGDAFRHFMKDGDGFVRNATETHRQWRYGFSDRLLVAEAFDVRLSCALGIARIEQLPWHQAESELKRIGVRWAGSRNPLVNREAPDFLGDETLFRATLVRLRVLRVAANWQATGEFADLADPFGSRLRMEVAPDRLKVWSVGPDGADDGGVGVWKADLPGPVPKDLVLEVRR